MIEFNIAPNTQIGRIEIPNKVYANENAFNIEKEKYSRGGEFIENLVTDNMIEYCHRWFHLANIEEFLSDMDEFYYKKGFGLYSNLISAGFGDGKTISAVLPTSSSVQNSIRLNQPKVDSPVIFYNKRDDKYNYNDLYSVKRKELS